MNLFNLYYFLAQMYYFEEGGGITHTHTTAFADAAAAAAFATSTVQC